MVVVAGLGVRGLLGLHGLRLAGDHGHLDRGELQVLLQDGLTGLQVDGHELLGLRVGDVGGVPGHLQDRAGLLPLVLLLPRLDHRVLGGDLTGLLVDHVDLAVVGQHDRGAVLGAAERAEPVGRAEVHGGELIGAGVDEGDLRGPLDGLRRLLLDLVIPQDDGRVMQPEQVPGALVLGLDVHLVELAVPVHDGPVLTAHHDDVARLRRLGPGLAVAAGAVVGLGLDLAGLRVDHLERVPGLLGALRGEEGAVGELERNAVVRVLGLGLRHDGHEVRGRLVQVGRVEGADRARAVREEGGLAGVGDDVAGMLTRERYAGHAGRGLVVVEVIAVGLGLDAGGEHLPALPGGHQDVLAVAGVAQPLEARDVLLLHHLTGLGVEQRKPVLVREQDARRHRGDLGGLGRVDAVLRGDGGGRRRLTRRRLGAARGGGGCRRRAGRVGVRAARRQGDGCGGEGGGEGGGARGTALRGEVGHGEPFTRARRCD
ncbi:hypothetical protein M3D09_001280 [Micrococcus luteus]|nr:hypothetical protein [Micrococcus luteus]